MDAPAVRSPAGDAVVVTRPEREALRWARALADRGIAAQVLPLIAIGPAPDADALARARTQLPACAAAMFVSANAVAGFFEGNQAPALVPCGPEAMKTRAWATGRGTRDALLQAGWPPQAIDAPPDDAPQFDSEALWRRVHGQLRPGDAVLLVRGADADGAPAGRDWLAQQLQAAGARVHVVASYARGVPSWDAAQRARARAAAADGSWWLCSSSQAIDHLRALLPGQDWSAARAFATHPRIAHAARATGFGHVAEGRPGLDALVAFLQSHR